MMSYSSTIKAYLRAAQNQYNNALSSGRYTAELSYRVPLNTMLKDLAREFAPSEKIDIILEPSNMGKAGRPDWLIENMETLAIYGFVEAKGISSDPFDTAPYAKQIKKYLTLGHKLIITDGIDFVFCMDEDHPAETVSLIDKSKMGRKDWSSVNTAPAFEVRMRDFFRTPATQEVNESKLVEQVAKRTRLLADEILGYTHIPPEEALDIDEKKVILLLQNLRKLVYNHNDPKLRTNEVFADFTAQVIMFCLLYAHRVLCLPEDTPVQKEEKIKAYISREIADGETLTPFRNLMLYLLENAGSGCFITSRINECIKFLSFVKMTDTQLMNPDYHQLFEMFLSRYDAKTRFDYGAYYTPKSLAGYIVKLTDYIVSISFPGMSIYDDDNVIIDPCCGTGSFIEELISHDAGNGAYKLCGFEILPAPYMLANYRMSIIEKQRGKKNCKIDILLANTLSNSVFNGNANKDSIEGRELLQANKLSSMPLKLIIGNPPCSDTIRTNVTEDFSIINDLMRDYRPPLEKRHGKQNIQKQINNPFMQFLRWSCKKLLDSQNHSVLALVVPLSFLEAESYKYARKYLCENFSEVWAVAVDADARTGARGNNLFYTMQGRSVIILTKRFGDAESITKVHYCDILKNTIREKEDLLRGNIRDIVAQFTEYNIDPDSLSFIPAKPFNTELYNKFWPVSTDNGDKSIFIDHCSGIKLAPTALFTHIKAPMLKRRSRDIATHEISETSQWFSDQDVKPSKEKITAFKNALNASDSQGNMDQTLQDNIHPYSFRPFLTSNVLLWKEVLKTYSTLGGGGTRLRPGIVAAYSTPDTIGFAMAHAPKDLNPTLSQFVSFCWYYPDNDMCTRGNSHVYTNQYADKAGNISGNISHGILDWVMSMTGLSAADASRMIVFYVYAILCSQTYLDEFEGALFTVSQSDNRARVPLAKDKNVFLHVASIGEKIALLEKSEFSPENVLNYDYETLMASIPDGFKLKFSKKLQLFDEDHELLLITDGNTTIKIDCPLSLQRLNISGYDVIKNVWLKFNSYNFTHCEFTQENMKHLLDFLNKLALHERYVGELDNVVEPILRGDVPLVERNEPFPP